jgi:hypothetical protein
VIRLYTFAVNRPDFLLYQFKTLQHFLKDEHQLIVINDGHDEGQGSLPDGNRQIRDMARSLSLDCHTVENPRRDTVNYGHARSVEFAYERFIRHDTDISVLLDGDMFLGKVFSVREYLDGYALAGWQQSRGHVRYLWPGLVFMDVATLAEPETLSFWPDRVDGEACDVGGHSYEYITRHPEAKVRWIDSDHICTDNKNLHLLPPDILAIYDPGFAIEILAKSFIHYRGGTNWDWRTDEFHERKSAFLFETLDRLMSGVSALL